MQIVICKGKLSVLLVANRPPAENAIEPAHEIMALIT